VTVKVLTVLKFSFKLDIELCSRSDTTVYLLETNATSIYKIAVK